MSFFSEILSGCLHFLGPKINRLPWVRKLHCWVLGEKYYATQSQAFYEFMNFGDGDPTDPALFWKLSLVKQITFDVKE